MTRFMPLLGLAFLIAAGPAAIDVHHSTITVFVNKQGLFSMFADNHQIDAPIAAGTFDAAQKTVTLSVNAADLRVLDPKAPASRRADVQNNMTGPQVLDAAAYPTIAFRSTKIDDGDATHWKVSGELLLHGQRHPVNLAVTKIDATHFSGSATIRQTAFGITPIKIAGGAVAVKDDVRVEFRIALSP